MTVCLCLCVCADAAVACGAGVFSCASGVGRVFGPLVGDGVCDCCDGSDEPAGLCANTCKAALSRLVATHSSRSLSLSRAQCA